MEKVFVRKIPMPAAFNAFILLDSEGNYNIYVNESLASNRLKPALLHELTHAAAGHLTDDIKQLSVIEKEANETLTSA